MATKGGSVRRRGTNNVMQSAKYKGLPDGFTDLFAKFGMGTEKVVRGVARRAEETGEGLLQGLGGILSKARTSRLYAACWDGKDELKKEARRLTAELVEKAREAEIFDGFDREKIICEAKKNIGEVKAKVTTSAIATRDRLLGMLDIPSQDEVARLHKKIAGLERRMSSLGHRAA